MKTDAALVELLMKWSSSRTAADGRRDACREARGGWVAKAQGKRSKHCATTPVQRLRKSRSEF